MVKNKKIKNDGKESQEARYLRVSSGVSCRPTVFKDRRKSEKKYRCRKSKGGNCGE